MASAVAMGLQTAFLWASMQVVGVVQFCGVCGVEW